MSSQSSISDFDESDQRASPPPQDRSAGHQVARDLGSQPDDRRQCLGCGGHVSRDYARVMGDADGRVHSCPECGTAGENCAGAAAGIEISSIHDSRQPDQ